MYTIWPKTDLIKSVDLILGMVKYILSNITQWHILLVICCNSFWRVNGFECYKQINSRLKFLYRKNKVLSPLLPRLLNCSLIQLDFDYTCLGKRWKSKLQIPRNKCIRFCLNLNNMAHIWRDEFKKINWVPVNNYFKQLVSSMSCEFCNNTSYVRCI